MARPSPPDLVPCCTRSRKPTYASSHHPPPPLVYPRLLRGDGHHIFSPCTRCPAGRSIRTRRRRRWCGRWKALFGLNRPVHEQYFIWLKNAVPARFWALAQAARQAGGGFLVARPGRVGTTGLLCAALCPGHRAAGRHHRRPASRTLAGPLGDVCGHSGRIGAAYRDGAAAGLALCLDSWIGCRWRSGPPLADGICPMLSHLILPAITLGAGLSAIIARLTRASLLQVLGEDYIRTAMPRGWRGAPSPCAMPCATALIPARHLPGAVGRCRGDRLAGGGADLCHPRHGALFCQQHHQPRLSDGDGRRRDLRLYHRRRQPCSSISLYLFIDPRMRPCCNSTAQAAVARLTPRGAVHVRFGRIAAPAVRRTQSS